MVRIFKKTTTTRYKFIRLLNSGTSNGGFSEIRSEILHVVGVTMTLPTFDVVSVNIPIISFSCCTHTFNDTNIGMYLLIVGKNVGGRRLQGQLCVWGAGKYPFRNVVLNTHVYRLLPILMYVRIFIISTGYISGY